MDNIMITLCARDLFEMDYKVVVMGNRTQDVFYSGASFGVERIVGSLTSKFSSMAAKLVPWTA